MPVAVALYLVVLAVMRIYVIYKCLSWDCVSNAVPGVLRNCLNTTCWSEARYMVSELTLVLRYALLVKRLSSSSGD